ncbi:unnamed protein product [Rhizoctonia solani]|uniref:F-box domain-containing protein n=1 Tax=Rhizoctonia solani TaxID=456999 RepID=A0A8H2WVL5_9AGAM|nr:unnamed protein product [Rhizoctonia solani]
MTTAQALRAPINALPSEILTRIFLFIVESRPYTLYRDEYDHTPIIPKHPDLLLLVSSRWRDIAISSRSLWSHIDIVLSCPQSEAFLARAKVYVARAGHIPLDIHIVDPGTHPRYGLSGLAGFFNRDSDNDDEDEDEEEDEEDSDIDLALTVFSENEIQQDNIRVDIGDFDCLGSALTPTAIRSLELFAYRDYHMSQLVALQHYLSRCAAGTLTQLLIRAKIPKDGPLGHFIEYAYIGGSLDIQMEDLQKPMSTLTILHLKGLYPYWTSQAYCGLTDLFLGGRVRIPEQQLVEILKSNPRLQALRLDCRVTDPVVRENEQGESEGEPPFDVHLENLEILDIHSLDYESATMLLRRLSYGSNPLRLCLSGIDKYEDISHFLIRSKNLNVTELRITSLRLHDLYDYLKRYPGLRTLVIGKWSEPDIPNNLSYRLCRLQFNLDWYNPGDKSQGVCLDTLYMMELGILDNELRIMIEYYSVRRLVLWKSVVAVHGPGLVLLKKSEIAELCRVVENLDMDEPNPVRQ